MIQPFFFSWILSTPKKKKTEHQRKVMFNQQFWEKGAKHTE